MGEINACLVLFGRITVTAKGDCFMRQKQRVVIYGLGWRYQKNKEAIESMPGIVAHCDQSEEKLRYFADGITVQQLAAHIDDYDVIYVAAAPMRVVPYLVDELHVPLEKIAFNKYEQLPNGGGTTCHAILWAEQRGCVAPRAPRSPRAAAGGDHISRGRDE